MALELLSPMHTFENSPKCTKILFDPAGSRFFSRIAKEDCLLKEWTGDTGHWIVVT